MGARSVTHDVPLTISPGGTYLILTQAAFGLPWPCLANSQLFGRVDPVAGTVTFERLSESTLGLREVEQALARAEERRTASSSLGKAGYPFHAELVARPSKAAGDGESPLLLRLGETLWGSTILSPTLHGADVPLATLSYAPELSVCTSRAWAELPQGERLIVVLTPSAESVQVQGLPLLVSSDTSSAW